MPPISHPMMTMIASAFASRRPQTFAVSALLAGLLAFTAGCAKKEKPRAQRVPVTVAAAVQRPMPFSVMASGTVEPVQTAAVGSQVGGTVMKIAFREGDEVRAGQVLIQLDPRPFRDALAQAEAMLAKDRAQAENARLQAERAGKLYA